MSEPDPADFPDRSWRIIPSRSPEGAPFVLVSMLIGDGPMVVQSEIPPKLAVRFGTDMILMGTTSAFCNAIFQDLTEHCGFSPKDANSAVRRIQMRAAIILEATVNE